MDAAARWLKKNDPLWKLTQEKRLRKKGEVANYYKNQKSTPHRSHLKKFPK